MAPRPDRSRLASTNLVNSVSWVVLRGNSGATWTLRHPGRYLNSPNRPRAFKYSPAPVDPPRPKTADWYFLSPKPSTTRLLVLAVLQAPDSVGPSDTFTSVRRRNQRNGTRARNLRSMINKRHSLNRRPDDAKVFEPLNLV